jgi:hypothetical protein
MSQYKPALTVLLQQQEAARASAARGSAGGVSLPPVLSPYRSKQAPKGLGRQQRQVGQVQAAAALNSKSAKGLLKSLSAAQLQPNVQQQQQFRSPDRAPRTQQQQPQQPSEAELWQADPPSKPASAAQLQPSSRQLNGSASHGALLPAQPGESFEAQAYRSLPAYSGTGSHFYSPAPARQAGPQVHRHEYADGTVVPECACARGKALEREQLPLPLQQHYNAQQQQVMADNARFEEHKEPNGSQQQPQSDLSPSQLARAQIPYAKQKRRPDSSRQKSVYASSFVAQPVQSFSKLGKNYFASHNKSYIRACLQDSGYGFDLQSLQEQNALSAANARGASNNPGAAAAPQVALSFAQEISQEHLDPQRRERIRASLPRTTHHTDFAPPSPELIKSYKRVGKDYRQSLNKSYIRENLLDPSSGVTIPPPGVDGSCSASHTVRVPFVATTTAQADFHGFPPEYYTLIREDKQRKIKFGAETGPKENIWQPWDDNMEP